MNVFEAVKQSVTTRQAAEHYGIHVGRNGMACCPFHNDKTPSMKLDRRYHCFGCGADGDVIDFAAALYGLRKKEAAVQLAQDFGLSYEDWKPPGKEKKPKPRQKSPEEQFQEAKNRCFRILADYLHLLREWRKDYAPHTPEEAFHTKDYVAPTSFVFKDRNTFRMGNTIGAVSYLQILAPELTDKMLAEFLDIDKNLIVNLHVQSVDQMKAIKLVKSKVTDINRMKIEEQARPAGRE